MSQLTASLQSLSCIADALWVCHTVNSCLEQPGCRVSSRNSLSDCKYVQLTFIYITVTTGCVCICSCRHNCWSYSNWTSVSAGQADEKRKNSWKHTGSRGQEDSLCRLVMFVYSWSVIRFLFYQLPYFELKLKYFKCICAIYFGVFGVTAQSEKRVYIYSTQFFLTVQICLKQKAYWSAVKQLYKGV